jgi:hypothetical protein
VLGGGPTIRFRHPWVGLVFCAAMLWMHAIWRGEMRTTDADREWSGAPFGRVALDISLVSRAGTPIVPRVPQNQGIEAAIVHLG